VSRFFIFPVILLVMGFASVSQAERGLFCRLSLPANTQKIIKIRLISGAAKMEYRYINNSNPNDIRVFDITSEVWGFAPNSQTRTAGYVSIAEVGSHTTLRRNYAINHCELNDPRKTCALELTATLSGIGMRVECVVPGI